MKKIYLIILMGFFLRFFGIHYSVGFLKNFNYGSLYPDENVLVKTSLENKKGRIFLPYFFDQGPGYCNFLTVSIISIEKLGLIQEANREEKKYYKRMGRIFLYGRYLSCLAGTLSLLIYFLLIKRITDENVAFISTLIFSILPGHVIISHFIKSDVWMILFVLLGLYAISFKKFTLGFFIFGIATGFKYISIFSILFSLLIFRTPIKLLYFLSFLLGLLLSSPQLIYKFPLFLEGIKYQYFLQSKPDPLYSKIKGFLWPEYGITFYYYLGPLICFILLFAFFWIIKNWKNFPWEIKGIILSILFYCFFLGFTCGPLMRYLNLIAPFLSLICASFIIDNKRNFLILPVIFIYTFLLSLKYDIKLTQEDPREKANYWVIENVSKCSRIGYFNFRFWLPTIFWFNNPDYKLINLENIK
ncbi:MAG: hypothetical protein DRI36_01805, partial [Caldiserica bacterium]